MNTFRETKKDEDKKAYFLALLVLTGENRIEETTRRFLCLNVQDLCDLFQYHTYLDEDAQYVFLPANQRVQRFFSSNRKKTTDFAGGTQFKK